MASQIRSNLILQPGVPQFLETGIMRAPYVNTGIHRVSHPFMRLASTSLPAAAPTELEVADQRIANVGRRRVLRLTHEQLVHITHLQPSILQLSELIYGLLFGFLIANLLYGDTKYGG